MHSAECKGQTDLQVFGLPSVPVLSDQHQIDILDFGRIPLAAIPALSESPTHTDCSSNDIPMVHNKPDLPASERKILRLCSCNHAKPAASADAYSLCADIQDRLPLLQYNAPLPVYHSSLP